MSNPISEIITRAPTSREVDTADPDVAALQVKQESLDPQEKAIFKLVDGVWVVIVPPKQP